MKILIKNATILTQNDERTILDDADIYIDGNTIVQIGRDLSGSDCGRIVEAKGMWAVPGFINAHVHLGESAYAPFVVGGYSLSEYLSKTETLVSGNPKIEEQRDRVANFSLFNIIKSGTTTICGGRTSEASERLGVRNISGYMLMNSNKLKHLQNDFEVNLSELINNRRTNLTTHAIFIHSLYAINEGSLKRVAEFLEKHENVRVMIHTGEEERDREDMAILKKNKLLGDRTILIHGNFFSSVDFSVIKDSSAHLVHCLTSNMRVNRDTLTLPDVIKMGCNVSIATDGVVTSSDFNILREAGAVYRYHNRFANRDVVSAQEIFDMITRNPAKALGQDSIIGSLEVGKAADLALLKSPFVDLLRNPVEQLISYANLVHVKLVMIDGQIIMEDSQRATKNSDSIESEFGEVVAGIKI